MYNFTIYNTFLYCNQELAVDDRVNDLVETMTTYEKLQNLLKSNPGLSRLGIPRNHYGECLHGVMGGCASINNTMLCPTSFSHALLMSATFNRTLWQNVATMSKRSGNTWKRSIFSWTICCSIFIEYTE